MINCEHVVVQHVFRYFLQLNLNKLYSISVTRIEEITYAISGTFQNTIVQGIFGRRVNNIPGVNLCQKMPLQSTSPPSPPVLKPNLSPQSHGKTSIQSVVNLKKTGP